MKNLIAATLFTLVFVSASLAQQQADGISLRSLGSNRDSFYFGEPVSFAFELKNNTALLKQYWKKVTGVNVYYKLINQETNKEVGNSEDDWESFEFIRDSYSSKLPDAQSSFLPHFSYYFIVDLAADLHSPLFEKHRQGLKYDNTLALALRALPEGEYKLLVEFLLLPGAQKIETEHSFQIKPLPEEEQEAYHAFLTSTVYAANSYYPGDNNYRPHAEKSYESFLMKYPESLFAEYAFFILIDKVYHYGGTVTIPQDVRQQTVRQYIANKDFTLANLKVKKAYTLAYVLHWAEGIDKRQALEQELLKLQEEDPVISDQLIKSGKERLQLGGFMNRALDQHE